MNRYPSPRTPGSTPGHDWEYSRMSSATPTPSPRPKWLDAQQTPRRPATRAAHQRVSSYSTQSTFSPRPPRDSPRYNSSGEYATADVSYQDFSSRGPSVSFHRSSTGHRRNSYTYVRSPLPHGESDEDEVIETADGTFVLPAESRSRSRRNSCLQPDNDGWYTNHGRYSQAAPYYTDTVYSREPSYEFPRPIAQPRPPTSFSHHRRASAAAVPQRPSTVRPTTQTASQPMKPPASPKATEMDAARHQIPAGYSLKNWDPREDPILLLGSVFDANSLGKWIYDWTVYKVGSRKPLAQMAGELWLLLLELTEKTKRATDIGLKARDEKKREFVNDYIDSSERLMDTLRLLLKNCEAPMLKAAKKSKSGLGKNSGVEFVDTLFGRDRELERTEKFMQKLRTWSHRFDKNIAPILENPTL